ncbi:MAG: D-alanine--D-alanine ligase [Ruminococcaceae bacterium]|nr:D-alanine--D-alanine ligase [Oscillospiraceae bacterium]
MSKKNIAVVFGGVSSEHPVSCVSAKSVIEHIKRDLYNVYMIGITKDGRWYLYEGDPALLPEDKWLQSSLITPAFISPDTATHGITVMRESGVETIYLDAVHPVLHGKNGEDGTIQGLFQLAQIPFVGCNHLSSAVSMDKAFTNMIADVAGIRQAKWRSIIRYEYGKYAKDFLDEAIAYLGFPIFVKPANAGSSVGISKAKNREELVKAMTVAFAEDDKVVLEEFIDGFEVECAVLGNQKAKASTVGEILPVNEFYDFEAKYVSGTTDLAIPAKNITQEQMDAVRENALKAYKALGCAGLSRVDFFVHKQTGEVFFNEINTLPGFTSISMYPKLWEASGVDYGELLNRLIELALERGGKI